MSVLPTAPTPPAVSTAEKLNRFLTFLEAQGISEPTDIDARQLRAFLVELSAECTAGGVHAHWRAVRAFVRFLAREEAIADNPLTPLCGRQALLKAGSRPVIVPDVVINIRAI